MCLDLQEFFFFFISLMSSELYLFIEPVSDEEFSINKLERPTANDFRSLISQSGKLGLFIVNPLFHSNKN